VPRLCEFYPAICLTTEDKARKNLSQGKKNLCQVKKNPSQSTEYILPKHPHITKPSQQYISQVCVIYTATCFDIFIIRQAVYSQCLAKLHKVKVKCTLVHTLRLSQNQSWPAVDIDIYKPRMLTGLTTINAARIMKPWWGEEE